MILFSGTFFLVSSVWGIEKGKSVVQQHEQTQKLINAVEKGDLQGVLEALDKGAPIPNLVNGKSLLYIPFMAIAKNEKPQANQEIIRILIQKKYPGQYLNDDIRKEFHTNVLAYIVSSPAFMRLISILEPLINSGVDINPIRDEAGIIQWLITAVFAEAYEYYKALARPQSVENRRIMEESKRKIERYRHLIRVAAQVGADLDLKDNSGQSPFDALKHEITNAGHVKSDFVSRGIILNQDVENELKNIYFPLMYDLFFIGMTTKQYHPTSLFEGTLGQVVRNNKGNALKTLIDAKAVLEDKLNPQEKEALDASIMTEKGAERALGRLIVDYRTQHAVVPTRKKTIAVAKPLPVVPENVGSMANID